jgi:hypothetical protein
MAPAARIAVLAAAWVALVLPSAALAATDVGVTSTPNATCTGTPEGELFSVSRATGPSSAMPHDGVITSWSFVSAAPVELVLRVFRAASAPNSWSVVADGGALQTLVTPGLHTFTTRIPVRRGDIAGLRYNGSGTCGNQTGDVNDRYATRGGTATPVGGIGTFLQSVTVRIDVAVVLEPDADHDGYGDDTQDGCPASAVTQSACPAPATKIKGKPDPQAAVSRVRLSSTIPGSTFTCRPDGKKAKPCRAKCRKYQPISDSCAEPPECRMDGEAEPMNRLH